MPTFTAIALDRLLERDSLRLPPLKLDADHRARRRPDAREEENRATSAEAPAPPPLPPRWPRVNPELYATPASTALPPDSPVAAYVLSPYVVDHKRRGPRLLKSFSQNDVASASNDAEVAQLAPPAPGKSYSQGDVTDSEAVVVTTNAESEAVKEKESGGAGEGAVNAEVVADLEVEEGDDFFDPQESMSVVSSSDVEDTPLTAERGWRSVTPSTEFYDAYEEMSSGSVTPSSVQNMEAELRGMRLSILMEIERRKQAEEALCHLQNQWQRLSRQLSVVGLTLPATATVAENSNGESDADPIEDLQQQVTLARVVAASIGRGCARAEAELELESKIESKNFEIARLWERLQYYEAANREMSQRNQETVEMARQQRYKRKRRQRWVWGSVGLAIFVGAAAVGWSYLPSSSSRPEEGCVDSKQ